MAIKSHRFNNELLPPPRRLCNRRCLSVCLLATLRKNFRTDLHEIFREGCQWTSDQTIKFWLRSESRIRIRIQIRIATLVRRALAEVCVVPLLVVVQEFSHQILDGYLSRIHLVRLLIGGYRKGAVSFENAAVLRLKSTR